jgi:glycosyltransferase involved in cell wall biosynthesis
LSLIERGDQVDVICLGKKGQEKRITLDGANVYRVQSRDYQEKGPLSYLVKMILFFIKSSIMAIRLHMKNHYPIFHFHNIPDFGVFATLIPKLMGARVIHDVHDLVPEFYQRKFNLDSKHLIIRLLKWIEKISCRYADHVITVTSIWQKTLVDRSISEDQCSIILNAPDPHLFHRGYPRKDPKDKPFRLVYHGNLTEIFGVDLAVRAMPMIRDAIPHVEFHIYGQGKTKDDLIKLARELGVEDSIHFNSPVVRIRVPYVLAQSDMGIDPKRDGILAGEGLSSKCMEFLAIGLPAVVSGIKAARTYYDESMVRFFQPGNETDLAQGVIELYKTPKKRQTLIKESMRFFEKHGWPIYEQVYYDLLDTLMNK